MTPTLADYKSSMIAKYCCISFKKIHFLLFPKKQLHFPETHKHNHYNTHYFKIHFNDHHLYMIAMIMIMIMIIITI